MGLLPIHRPAPPAPAGVGAAATSPPAAKVLLVDDEEVVARVGRAALQKRGYSVLTASTGEAALDILHAGEDLDAVVIDVTMPGMSGVHLFDELRRLRPAVPIVVSSGHSPGEVARMFAPRRPDAFLTKPYRPVEIAAAVFEALQPK